MLKCVNPSNTSEENTVGLSGEPVVRLEGSRFFKKIKKCIFPQTRLLNPNLQSGLLRKMFYLTWVKTEKWSFSTPNFRLPKFLFP